MVASTHIPSLFTLFYFIKDFSASLNSWAVSTWWTSWSDIFPKNSFMFLLNSSGDKVCLFSFMDIHYWISCLGVLAELMQTSYIIPPSPILFVSPSYFFFVLVYLSTSSTEYWIKWSSLSLQIFEQFMFGSFLLNHKIYQQTFFSFTEEVVMKHTRWGRSEESS